MVITALMLIRLITSILRTEIETDENREFKSTCTTVGSLHPRFGGLELNSTWTCANANHSSYWKTEEPCWFGRGYVSGWGFWVTGDSKDDLWMGWVKKQMTLKTGEGEKKKFSISHKRAVDKFLGTCRMFVWPGSFLPAGLCWTSDKRSFLQWFVLFLLAEEAEPFLAVLVFPIFVAHGNTSSFGRAGRDGRHGHGTAECPGTYWWVSSSRWNRSHNGTNPGAHFSLKSKKKTELQQTHL